MSWCSPVICTSTVLGGFSYDPLWYIHCKKICRSSSTPASGDAGPIQTGVEKSFRHPWRKIYYKYQTFPTFFASVELVCYDLDDSRQTYCLQMSNFFDKTWMPQNYSDTTRERTYVFRFTFQYSTTAPHFLILEAAAATNCLCKLFREKDTFWVMVHGISHAKKNHE
jgi:hypothetical protein